MNIAVILVLILVIAGLLHYILHMKQQLKQTSQILDDIKEGNLDRKMIAKDSSEYADVCYKINEIASKYKTEIENLAQSEKTYRQLITSLSHDIRTPLASLLGYLSAIEDGIVKGKEKEEFFALSKEKAETLKQYVDTLFDWLKLESGEQIYHFEMFDVNELMREVIAEWFPQVEKRDIELFVDIPEKECKLMLDAASIRRIINNLMQNIFIHSKAKKVDITLEESADMVVIYVKDYGVGIPEQDLPHIFERLYKCDAARSEKGNGLGLAITSELVKANHGEISVESKLGEGTVFMMKFPKA